MGTRGTVGPIFSYGEGEGGEEGAHPPLKPCVVLGPLADCPQDNNFPLQQRREFSKTERPREECSQEVSIACRGESERASLPHLFSTIGTQGPFPSPGPVAHQSLALRARA